MSNIVNHAEKYNTYFIKHLLFQRKFISNCVPMKNQQPGCCYFTLWMRIEVSYRQKYFSVISYEIDTHIDAKRKIESQQDVKLNWNENFNFQWMILDNFYFRWFCIVSLCYKIIWIDIIQYTYYIIHFGGSPIKLFFYYMKTYHHFYLVKRGCYISSIFAKLDNLI